VNVSTSFHPVYAMAFDWFKFGTVEEVPVSKTMPAEWVDALHLTVRIAGYAAGGARYVADSLQEIAREYFELCVVVCLLICAADHLMAMVNKSMWNLVRAVGLFLLVVFILPILPPLMSNK